MVQISIKGNETLMKTKERRNERQADTKDLTSSSKFSASCVLTSQTIPFLKQILLDDRFSNIQRFG